MLNRTVTTRFPGLTMRRALSATLLRTVTVTVIQEPAAPSDPDGGDTVTLPFGLVTAKLTGPPTAVTMNVPLAGLPLTADSTRSFGVTCRVPGVGGGDGEGDGDGDGGGDGGGEDGVGADERGASGDVLWPAVGPSVGDVAVLGDPDAGVGLRPGEDCAPAWLDAAIDGAADVPKLPPPRATVEARARCVPPAISSTAIPPATAATATAATPAVARGRRRAPCHHRGPGGMIGFGNPVRPNAPARCVTLTRSARPVGVLSAPACSTRSRRASGGLTCGTAPTEASRAASAEAGAEPGGIGREPRGPEPRGPEPRGPEPRGPEPAQAFVPCDRVQPGAELVRIAEPLELGGGDGKGVRHGVGGLTRRMRVGQQGPAVGV